MQQAGPKDQQRTHHLRSASKRLPSGAEPGGGGFGNVVRGPGRPVPCLVAPALGAGPVGAPSVVRRRGGITPKADPCRSPLPPAK